MGKLFVSVISIIALAVIVYLFQIVWTRLDAVEVSFHGNIALIILVVFSIIVSGGLMALMFYSSNKGFDDGAHDNIERVEPSEQDK